MVDAQDSKSAAKRLEIEVAARRDIEILAKILHDPAFERRPAAVTGHFAKNPVGPGNIERQVVPHMPDNDLELRKAIE